MRIYFYFLATKIVIIKFFKKIYFSTSYYNKFLQSRIPERFHYYPNPFLLSIFKSHKNFSFKVEDVKPHIFWTKKETRKERDNLNRVMETARSIWVKNQGKSRYADTPRQSQRASMRQRIEPP